MAIKRLNSMAGEYFNSTWKDVFEWYFGWLLF